jgi:acetylornithine deacetylase/succinyl-diaminopimelate desuccinylase-like protein
VGPADGHHPGHRLPAGGRLVGGDPAAGAGATEPAGAAGHGSGGRPGQAATPWHAQVTFEPGGLGAPFAGSLGGPAFDAMGRAMHAAYGRDLETQGQGGSIPLCPVFQETFPDAEIMLLGVCEPECRIHAPNESVDPSEVQNMALVLATFLGEYAAG